MLLHIIVKNMKQKLYFSAIIFFGFILILTIKYIIRPLCLHYSKSVTFILGVAPNFLIGIIFPITILLIYPKLKIVWLFLISFISIILMEYDLFLAGRNFDISDIISSIIGMSISYFLINTIPRGYNK